MKKRKIFPAVYIAMILFILYIPIVVTVVYSFNVSKITSVWGGWTLDWYHELFQDRALKEALVNSLILGIVSSLLAIVIGTAGALGMRKKKTKVSGMMSYISSIPIMIPEIILGMVFLAVFSLMNLPFGMLTLIIAHTSFCIPYVFMMVRTRLAGMDMSLEEAARDLGASRIRTFFDITLPAILPAVLSGGLLSFVMSFDDVVISIFVTGASTNMLPVKIYTKVKTGVTPEINALATILLLVTIVLVVIYEWSSTKQEKNSRNESV